MTVMNVIFKISLPVLLVVFFSIIPAERIYAQDPITEAIRQAVIKVIKAIDLQVQRLQNKTIDLQNIQKQVENALSKLKLQEIADWTDRQKKIYEDYFDELWRVKSIIAYYKRITEVIGKAKQLIVEYKRANAAIRSDNNFTQTEIEHIRGVYSGIIDKSAESLDQILILLESFSMQMSDAQRLELLNRSADEIETCITDLRRLTDQNVRLSLQRARNLEEINRIKKLYGIDD
jgi:hypothetical protein